MPNCSGGRVVDSCDPLAGATADTKCNGVDEDCDGTADDGYVPGDELRRWSVLGQYGQHELLGRQAVDSCDPLAGATADTKCNGVDEDCDGTADDGYVPGDELRRWSVLGQYGLLNCSGGRRLTAAIRWPEQRPTRRATV